MKFIKNIFLIVITIFSCACNSDDYTGDVPNPKKIQLKVIGRGAAIAQTKTFTHPKTGEALEADSFLMDLIDPDTGNIIGTLQHCVVDRLVPSDGTITSRVITSINIHGRGTIQAESILFQEMQPPEAPEWEVIFGTSFTPTENNVIDTTLEFEGMEGTVSLDGEENFSDLVQGFISFDYTFTIELEND